VLNLDTTPGIFKHSKLNAMKMNIKAIISSVTIRPFLIYFISVFFFISCNKFEDKEVEPSSESKYLTENLFIVVIDGPRFIDTWSNPYEDLIPNMRNLTNEGVFFNDFYNEGFTKTVSGHTAIVTGSYEELHNNGTENPMNPSIFQRYLADTYQPPYKTCIVTGKEKLNVLSNCKDLHWHDSFLPYVDAIDRLDEFTLFRAKMILDSLEPKLGLIHFKEPDLNGHNNRWDEYLTSITAADAYVADLWNFIQNHDTYKNKTTLLITADHGRHLDGIRNGFINHGDKCEGCRHIFLLALGPDFEKGKKVDRHYEQIDIAPTIAEIINFEWEGSGTKISELTK